MGTRSEGGGLGEIDLVYVARGLSPGGVENDDRTSIIYDAGTGRIAVDAPLGVNLKEINIVSSSEIFTGDIARNLPGEFDFQNETTIFKTTLNAGFGSLSFGNVVEPGVLRDRYPLHDDRERFLLDDLRVTGKLADGRDVVDVDLIYLPGTDPPTISVVPQQQAIDEDHNTGRIPITIGDAETPANLLVLTAASSNPSLVPVANIVLGGTGASRSMTITPSLNASGEADVILTVTDSVGGTATATFKLIVHPINDLPSISNVADLSIVANSSDVAVDFTVNDVETSAAVLKVTATSSNTTLVPIGNIILTGSGANRTASIFPAANQVGTTTITLTVKDDHDPSGESTETFDLTIIPTDDPKITLDPNTAISGQCTEVNSPTGVISIKVDDVNTPAHLLTLLGSSTPSIVSGFAFGGTGKDRTVIITPALNQTGTTTVKITVRDGEGLTASQEFALTIVPFRPQAGDANMDRQFNQLDLVQILQAAKYQTGQQATFADGDWNGDRVFDPRDVVLALQTGSYLQGPYRTTSCDTAPIL